MGVGLAELVRSVRTTPGEGSAGGWYPRSEVRRANTGKGIMSIAGKDWVGSDIVTKPENQLLEAVEEWGEVCEEKSALEHTGVWARQCQSINTEGTRWTHGQGAGPVSAAGPVLGLEDKCPPLLMEAGG